MSKNNINPPTIPDTKLKFPIKNIVIIKQNIRAPIKPFINDPKYSS